MLKKYIHMMHIGLIVVCANQVGFASSSQGHLTDCFKNSYLFEYLRETSKKKHVASDRLVSLPQTFNSFTLLKNTLSNKDTYPISPMHSCAFQVYPYSHVRAKLYLLQAKELFNKPDADIEKVEKLQLLSVNETVKSKLSTHSELSLIDYNDIADKEVTTIPYIQHAIGALPQSLRSYGHGTVIRQKFLVNRGVPIGWIQYSYRKNRDNHYDAGSIDYIGVKEEQRRKGFGALLMTYALHEMEVVGVSHVSLRLDEHNKDAHIFHKKMGFSKVRPGLDSEMHKKLFS